MPWWNGAVGDRAKVIVGEIIRGGHRSAAVEGDLVQDWASRSAVRFGHHEQIVVGGICSGHVLLLKEAVPPWSSVLQRGIDLWKHQSWDTLDIISWGRAWMEPGAIPYCGNGVNSDTRGCCCQGGDQETLVANKTRPVETIDPDG